MRSVYFFILFSAISLNLTAIAKDKNNILFDYSTMSLNSVGVYNPKMEGEKTGLNAELIARKNGIDNLEKYFESSCDGMDKSSLSVKNDWENNFHSQGTEIFSNGVLAVTLQAQIKQIFKTSFKLKKIIKTDEGEKIAFQFPQQIPLAAIRCGTLEVVIGNKKIHVFPMETFSSDANRVKIIHLVYNKANSNLELDPLTKAKDSEIIENSTLTDMDDIASVILPISVAINDSNEE